MDTATNSHDNAKIPEFCCTADYLDDFTHVLAEKVASETFHVEMKEKNHVLSAAGILFRINRECLKRFSNEVLHFLYSSVLTSSEYTNELLTLIE